MAARGIYKVIPSGVTESGRLRATLMLSPAITESELKTLPSQLVKQWRDERHWTMQLKVVKLWVTGGECVASLDKALSEATTCEAKSFSGAAAWGAKEAVKWLDDLWTESLVGKEKKPDQAWQALADLLEVSNCGTALQPGSGLCKSPFSASATPASSAEASAARRPPPLDDSTTHLQTILPSRQSDLALLLESERALEICATARWAHGDYESCRAEEEVCHLMMEHGGAAPSSAGTDNSKKPVDLREEAKKRFEAAQFSVAHLYECKADTDAKAAPVPWLVEASTIGAGREKIAKAIPAAAGTHRDANQVEEEKAETADKQSGIAQNYFAVQGSPALSRLFGLTVDLEVESEGLNSALGLSDAQKGDEATIVHLLLGVNTEDGGSRPVFTLARYRPALDKHSIKHFMPASRLELRWQDRTSFHPQASQHEGVLILGQTLEAGESKEPLSRFVLSSLDVPRATNGALDRIGMPPTKKPNSRLIAEEQVRNREKRIEDLEPLSKEPLLARKPTRWARKTHSTAGLLLLDRGRAEQALQQFAARSMHENRVDLVLLDSNDLLIGYRLDVGVPITAGKSCDFAWRSLMARDIQHGNGGPHAASVSKKVPLLMGGSSGKGKVSTWQQTLDDSQLSLPARLVDSADPTTEDINAKDAYVEEVVAVWTGEPMAALCAAAEKDKEADADVGAGEVISLPLAGNNSDRVPPVLRFGWPYRLGVRAVYAGGISQPLAHARRLYDGKSACTSKNSLALPAREEGKTSGIRRFLRHERIAAPFLLMHKNIALPRDTPKMGYERSAHAIVRSTPGEPVSAFGDPKETRRIFVPPSVEMHFAAMHGVFDDMAEPVQGLRHMRFNAKMGGFPYVTAKSVEAINGETFYGKRSISSDGDERGDAVYVEEAAARPHAYFPDPAARVWVVAVRHAGTNHYLEGPARTVPIRKHSKAYPECKPLVVRIVRDTSPRPQSANPTLQQVVSVSPGVSTHAKDGVEVVVKLAPGEDFEVDVWCIPDAEDLAEFFAPVESIGALALLRAGSTENLPLVKLMNNLTEAFKAMLPPAMVGIVLKNLEGCGCWPPSDKLQNFPFNDGVGGVVAPGREMRNAIAKALYETLCIRPVDEIAAVQSLRVTHVTSVPVRRPAFEPIDSERRLGTRRAVQDGVPMAMPEGADVTAAASAASSASSVAPAASSASSASFSNSTQAKIDQGAKGKGTPDVMDYFLTGDVRVDFTTTGAIEFRARATSPTTSAFDDPRRGRSARDKRNAAWPSSGDAKLSTEAVFGFDVCTDGKVTLPMREISLLQIEDLAQPTPGLPSANLDGLWRLNMENLTAGQSCSAWGRVASRHVFPDRKARRLRVRMIPRTRHEELMRAGSGEAKFGEWLRPGEESRAPKDPGDESAVEIWLLAGIRPSEPVTKTPIPAFDWEDLGTSINRRTVIRIPLGRGWFSSGEGERLGIVVWPSGALDAAATVPRRGEPVASRHQVPLPKFMDEDLGPGGKFVTRWGSDPTRPIDSEARVEPNLPGFLDPSAFRDISTRSGARFNVELVSQVRMPVRRDATAVEDDSNSLPVTLEVSLVTYEPLFDIETEQWYVDISLDHAFEAQPFVRLGLVRYQPNAPEELQVSFPTVQWVQMLPERSAWMFTEDEGKEKSTWLAVEGLGPADVSTDAGNRFVGTRMMARVVTEYKNAAGLPCRHARPSRDMQAERKNSGPNTGAPYGGPRWRWTLKIDVDELARENEDMPKGTHYVYIEEREAYLPATYAKEPVSSEVAAGRLDPCEHVESGPRFAVRLPLRRPVPLKK